MIRKTITDLVGNTPLLKLGEAGLEDVFVYVKMESFNPTGSIKDRTCLANLNAAIADGQLTQGKTILDASSGNMACSLAYFGHVLGYAVKVICNSKLTADKKDFINFFGAEIVMHGDFTIEGNRLCRRLSEEDKYCFLDQLHNPANPRAAYETLAPEIFADLGDVTAIVGSMGSGGSMCGVARYCSEKHPHTHIFTTQAAPGTKIPGTGAFDYGDYVTPFVEELRGRMDDTFEVTHHQAETCTKQLARMGVFAGLQAGGVFSGLVRAVKKHRIRGNVVMIIGDAGWKNMEKLKAMS